jgi:Na+-transporting NADH:ubiquinone oxidoreductase subunit NqrF
MEQATPMNFEMLPKVITDAYKMFDQLNLSVTSLVVIGVVLTLMFLFAAREAAAWFFKVDDVKRDVRKLRQLVIDLEGEMRSLQGLLNQNIALANSKIVEDATAKEAAKTQSSQTTQTTKTESASKFSINH